jgi:hypothetical protein
VFHRKGDALFGLGPFDMRLWARRSPRTESESSDSAAEAVYGLEFLIGRGRNIKFPDGLPKDKEVSHDTPNISQPKLLGLENHSFPVPLLQTSLP